MKPLYPYISFVAILLLGMFFSFSNYYTSKNILDVDNVMVNKDNTVSFTFSLSQDDIISIGTTKKDGKREKFNIRILNVNTDTPFSFSSTTAEYVIPEDGLYKVEFKNRRKIYLDIDVELRTDIEAGGINLQKATFYVGPDKKRFKQSQFDKPIFSFTGLEEGSQVAIGCGDRGQAAQLLRCRYRQMDDTRYVNTGPNYTIQEQGDMIIDFSLDEQNEGLVEKLFKGKKDLLFEDVIFTYTPKEEEYIPPRVVADAGGDPMADYFANLDSQAEMENQNMEAMALLQQQGIDANAEMVEGIGKVIQMMLPQQQIEHKAVFDNTYTLREKGATEEYFTVYPTMDLINGNKVCFSLIGVDESQLWAYWFGTGENSKEIYTKEVKGSSGETSDETIKRAYKKAFDKKTMVSKNIFPRQDLFDEAINFVLVDDVNREKFMNDESYVPYKGTMGMFNTQYSRFPFINSMDSNSIPLNACFCNYNKYTPISVHFRYYMGSVEEEIKSVLPSQMNPTPPAQK